MTERLIWNFELASDAPIDFTMLSSEAEDAYKWEARFFWKQDAAIVLHGLTADLLSLAKASFKTHQDVYVIVPSHGREVPRGARDDVGNSPLNLKYRKNHLVYKPLMQKHNGLCAYGKKIKLDELALDTCLPETAGLTKSSLNALVQQQGHEIALFKEAVCFEFPTVPNTQLELSKISVNPTRRLGLGPTPVVGPRPNLHFSACIEGKSQALVDQLRRLILPDAVPYDYPTFLAQEILSC